MFGYLLDKKDVFLGFLGVIFLIISIVFIGFGIKKSLENELAGDSNQPILEEESKEERFSLSGSREGGDQSKKDEEEIKKEDSDQQSGPGMRTPKNSEPVPSKKGIGVIEVPSKSAEEPGKEDIDQVVISESECQPRSVKVKEDKGLILEVTAKDADYLFKVKGVDVEEVISKKQTTIISVPSFLISGLDKAVFRCYSLD